MQTKFLNKIDRTQLHGVALLGEFFLWLENFFCTMIFKGIGSSKSITSHYSKSTFDCILCTNSRSLLVSLSWIWLKVNLLTSLSIFFARLELDVATNRNHMKKFTLCRTALIKLIRPRRIWRPKAEILQSINFHSCFVVEGYRGKSVC